MSDDLSKWALPRIGRLLPIDDESLKEVINYTASLSKEAGAEHLKNLLGDSPQAFEFISAFNSRREDVLPPKKNAARQANTPQHTDSEGTSSPRRRPPKKAKAPLHNAGPVRQPEGYGNVDGGYKKSYNGDNYLSGSSRQAPSATSLSDALSLSAEPVALQVPKVSQMSIPSPGPSREPSPGYGRHKLPPSAAGNLISDLPNVRSKQSRKTAHATHSGTSTPRNSTVSTTTSSIADLTSAIAALEIATNPALSTERRKCDCNASIHPLFATAPNCLSCGKIICALEGLQPCSYCNAPILTKDQVDSMIRALKDERGVEKMATHNAGVSLSGRGTPMLGGSTPDSSGDESSSAAARARAHRDKLLAFQRENAQRTRVHDEAADYETTLTPGTTQWMSPMQRAAALKKQQAYMRELQEANRPEWEKKRTVMSMSIKNGKLVKTYGREKAPAITTDSETEQEHDIPEDDPDVQRLTTSGKGAFSNNPLLASGHLVRPIWKSKGDTEVGELGGSTRERRSVWRRVQDDEDNEKYLLDGGPRGYDTELRLMEDGSQQECG